jgi:hypothetical protein
MSYVLTYDIVGLTYDGVHRTCDRDIALRRRDRAVTCRSARDARAASDSDVHCYVT